MTAFEIVDAKPYHVGRILRMMPQDQLGGVLSLAADPHRELRSVYQDSSFRRAWMIDGQLAGLGGIAGPAFSTCGFVWLVLAKFSQKYRVEMVRSARAVLDQQLALRSRITTTIVSSDAAALRFARFLGFRASTDPAAPGVTAMELRHGWPLDAAEPPPPFVVFSLPRSRSAWLSSFLSYGGWLCRHDMPVTAASAAALIDDLGAPWTGSTETGLARGWRLIRDRFPAARFAVVRRPVAEVRQSAARFGWIFPEGYLESVAADLDEIARLPGTIVANFGEIGREQTAAALFEHCLGLPFDRDWWESCERRNIQIDMDARMAALVADGDRLARIFREIDETITVQREPLASFLRDCWALSAAHHAEAHPDDGAPFDPDIEYAEALEHAGQLVVLCARRGRRLIGYLLLVITRNLEYRGQLAAVQSTFFVDRPYRGSLGRRIIDAAVDELRSLGIRDLVLRSGVRARGPALKHLYQRMGAEFMGDIYNLKIGED